jgi:hypothetical protein
VAVHLSQVNPYAPVLQAPEVLQRCQFVNPSMPAALHFDSCREKSRVVDASQLASALPPLLTLDARQAAVILTADT